MIDPAGKFLSGASLAEPIMAGYSVHYTAIAFAAYGVANAKDPFLTLGIGLEMMIGPVMAMAKGVSVFEDWAMMGAANQVGDFMLPAGAGNWNKLGKYGKWIGLGILGTYVAGDLLMLYDSLPSENDWREFWNDLKDGGEKFELPVAPSWEPPR